MMKKSILMAALAAVITSKSMEATKPVAPEPCDHDWPEAPDGSGTDMDGSCTKCGMSFQRYIHTECP